MWCQKPALRSHTVMHVFIHIQIQMCITNSQSLFVKLWDWQSDFSYFFGFSHSTLRHDMHQHLKSVWQIFVSHAPTANRNQLERCTDVTTSRLEPSGRSAAPQPHREQSFSFLYVDFDVYYIVFFWLILKWQFEPVNCDERTCLHVTFNRLLYYRRQRVKAE